MMRIQTEPNRWDVYVELDGESIYRWAGDVTEVMIGLYRADLRTGRCVGEYKTRQSATRALAREFAQLPHVSETNHR